MCGYTHDYSFTRVSAGYSKLPDLKHLSVPVSSHLGNGLSRVVRRRRELQYAWDTAGWTHMLLKKTCNFEKQQG